VVLCAAYDRFQWGMCAGYENFSGLCAGYESFQWRMCAGYERF
jgi:hypothetical protein